jgi:GDPmannose 4,6-dehydratase
MKAVITGVNGQDGYYLADFLLKKGYEVYGFSRPSTTNIDYEIESLKQKTKFHIISGDILDKGGLKSFFYDIKPNEIYNLAAQSHVHTSFQIPEYTGLINGIGVLNILESLKQLKMLDSVRFYQASTSELYGKIQDQIQTEATPFYPRSPYAVAKLYGYWITVNYREAYNAHASNGILFNHESPRRGKTFVTRKISKGVANISKSKQEFIELGNLDARRDWGHARDFVKGMWLMLQQDKPDDYVLATGITRTVREFVEKAFLVIGVKIVWEGNGIYEVGKSAQSGNILVKVDPKFYRPSEVDILIGDATKAKKKLGWSPEISFESLVEEMVKKDLEFD